MRSTVLKRGLVAGVALSAGLSSLGFAPTAQAQSPAGNTTWPASDVMIMAAGSDTTQNMMNDILAAHDGEAFGAGTMHTYNLAAVPSSTVQVDGDAQCSQHAWIPGSLVYTAPPVQWTAPAGSSAGRDYLKTQHGFAGNTGCVDIARSSGGPKSIAGGGDVATYEYYAYALDDVTWATPSLKAPSNLSRNNIQDIYACRITDWSDPHLGTAIPSTAPAVGTASGAPGAIQRYLPQPGSGTRGFFLSAFGITSADIATTNASCPAVKVTTAVPVAGTPFEENRGDRIDFADYDKAILPYSSAVWNFQYGNKLNPTIDVRNSVRLGGFVTNPSSGSPVKSLPILWNGVSKRYKLDPVVVHESNVVESGATVNMAAETYNGVRYVYNVLDNVGPSYAAAFSLVGFDNTSPAPVTQPLCSGGHAGEIGSNFFLALDTTNDHGHNVPGGNCRKIPLVA